MRQAIAVKAASSRACRGGELPHVALTYRGGWARICERGWQHDARGQLFCFSWSL